MTLAIENARPSSLADVIGQVRDAFDAMGDATPIMVGERYLEDFGVGSAPRVLFVPEVGGSLGPPLEMGSPCSVTSSCDVYVRAVEKGDDADRFEAAYDIMRRVVSCVARAATGRVEWGKFADSSPTDTDAFGAELKGTFLYRWDLRHDEPLWSLPAATADTTASGPVLPPGIGFDIDDSEGAANPIGVVVTPQE